MIKFGYPVLLFLVCASSFLLYKNATVSVSIQKESGIFHTSKGWPFAFYEKRKSVEFFSQSRLRGEEFHSGLVPPYYLKLTELAHQGLSVGGWYDESGNCVMNEAGTNAATDIDAPLNTVNLGLDIVMGLIALAVGLILSRYCNRRARP